jgi:hypothetical protein
MGWMPLQAESLEGASLLAPSFFGASNDGCEGPQPSSATLFKSHCSHSQNPQSEIRNSYPEPQNSKLRTQNPKPLPPPKRIGGSKKDQARENTEAASQPVAIVFQVRENRQVSLCAAEKGESAEQRKS